MKICLTTLSSGDLWRENRFFSSYKHLEMVQKRKKIWKKCSKSFPLFCRAIFYSMYKGIKYFHICHLLTGIMLTLLIGILKISPINRIICIFLILTSPSHPIKIFFLFCSYFVVYTFLTKKEKNMKNKGLGEGKFQYCSESYMYNNLLSFFKTILKPRTNVTAYFVV